MNKGQPYTGYIMPYYAGGLDEAADIAEKTNDYVVLQGAPRTMKYGSNPHYLISPRRMVMTCEFDAHMVMSITGETKYHPKI